MLIRSALVLLPLLFASCQSMSEGIVSLEGRAMVFNDTSVDREDPLGGINDTDLDVTSYGVQAALMTPIVDVVGSLDWRDYDGDGTPELDVGARRRFLEIGPVHPYVEANLRYGFDLDTGQTSDDFFGWNAGIGALIDLTDHLFLNARVIYETADIELPGGSQTADGIAGTIGLGLTF